MRAPAPTVTASPEGAAPSPSCLTWGQRGWKRQAGCGGQHGGSFGPSVELE